MGALDEITTSGMASGSDTLAIVPPSDYNDEFPEIIKKD
jgi:hypothetical protein